MCVPKSHHLIPQTYLRSWCFSGESIYCFNKNELFDPIIKNIANNFGQNNYHSIRAGMACCTDEDLAEIFKSLLGFRIKFDDKDLNTLQEYNRYYYDFNNWEIFYPKGAKVSRAEVNRIKADIERNKVLDIEEMWNMKYENGWNTLLQMIEQRIKDATGTEIDEFYKGRLMKFIVSLDWRSLISNESLNETFDFINTLIDLKSIDIPFDERNVRGNETAYDEVKHNYLLKQFALFLEDRGIMYDAAKGYIKYLTIKFIVCNGESLFITSDNPSFISNENGEVRHYMPVTPQILICIEKDSQHKQKYYIERIKDSEVKRLNLLIAKSADEIIISKTDNI